MQHVTVKPHDNFERIDVRKTDSQAAYLTFNGRSFQRERPATEKAPPPSEPAPNLRHIHSRLVRRTRGSGQVPRGWRSSLKIGKQTNKST